MRHLNQEELLMAADGEQLSSEARAHLTSCPSCAAECERLHDLLSAVRDVEEPPLEDRLLDSIAEGVMERISYRAERRSQSRGTKKWWCGVKWASAAALPLAAALLLFVLPLQESRSPRVFSGQTVYETDDLLAPNQWDIVWQNLIEDMPELLVLDQISSVDDENPYEQIHDLTEDELESLLVLLSGSNTS